MRIPQRIYENAGLWPLERTAGRSVYRYDGSQQNKVKVVQVELGTVLYPKKPSPQCKGVKRIVWSRGSTSGRIAAANYKVAEVLCGKLNAAPLALQAVELAGDKAVREYAEHIVATEIMGKL